MTRLAFVALCLLQSRMLVLAEDPCQPNPCGENTGSSVISCNCAEGYIQGDSGECVRIASRAVAATNEQIDPPKSTPATLRPNLRNTLFRNPADRPNIVRGGSSSVDISITRAGGNDVRFPDREPTTTATPRTTRATTPRPRRVPVALQDDASDQVLGGSDNANGAILIDTNPRFFKNPFKRKPGARRPSSQEELDKLFPEECLVHEDCNQTHFCDQNTYVCKAVCAPENCGTGAQCRPVLNRPLCYCPDDYEGNPYKECVRSPSRVGLRFKRWQL